MKVKLNKPIIGYMEDTDEPLRKHADADDVLVVILNNVTHFICDSKYFPNQAIVVFPNQCEEIITEKEPDAKETDELDSNVELNDSLYTEHNTDDE